MIKSTFKDVLSLYKNFLFWNMSKTYALWISFIYSLILVTPLLIWTTFILISQRFNLSNTEIDYTSLQNVPGFIPLAIFLILWFLIFLVVSSYKWYLYYKISKSISEWKKFNYPKHHLIIIIIWFLVISTAGLFSTTLFALTLIWLIIFFIPSLIKNWSDLMNFSKIALPIYLILIIGLILLFALTIPFSYFWLDNTALFVIFSWLLLIWTLYLRLEFSFIQKIENPELNTFKAIKLWFSTLNWNLFKFMLTYIIVMIPFVPLIIINLSLWGLDGKHATLSFIVWLLTFLIFSGVHQMVLTSFYKKLNK